MNFAFPQAHDRRSAIINATLVADYKRAHLEMLAAIDVMEELSRGGPPNQLRLSHTRLRINRSSHESRAAFDRVVSQLSKASSPTLASKIKALQKLHLDLREAARTHLAKWTHQHAANDWQGYCQSSAEVRKLWRSAIDRERLLLYPFL